MPPNTPGPGTYNVDQKPGGPRFTISGRFSPTRANQNPGPGTYTPQSTRPTSPAFSMGSRDNTSSTLLDRKLPGPGTYDLSRPKKGPSFTIGDRITSDLLIISRPSTPGPGSYDIPSTIEGPKFSLLGRLPPPQSSNNPKCGGGSRPGPGSYTIKQKPASPSFSMGALIGRPISNMSMNTPGPGTYNPREKKKGPAYSLTGKPTNRPGADSRFGNPGPGTYDTSRIHAVGKDAPSYSLTSKPQEPRKYTSPGPGSYNLPKSSNGPSFSLKSKTNYPPIPDLGRPGPGEYNPNPWAVGKTSPSYGMGRRLEKPNSFRTARTAGPGPGAYNTFKKSADGPAFSIFPKLKRAEDNRNPGPGAYDASLNYTSNCRKSPAYSLGTGLCSRESVWASKNVKKPPCRGSIPPKQVSTRSSAGKSADGSGKAPRASTARPSDCASKNLREKTNASKPSKKPFKNP